MEMAYAAADLVVCRSGALTMAELAVTRSPSILVPSPNVAEDHQYKNAQVFAQSDAAVVIRDSEFGEIWLQEVRELLSHPTRLKELSHQIGSFAKHSAADEIVSYLMNQISCK